MEFEDRPGQGLCVKRLSRTERARENRVFPQADTTGYILLKGGCLCSPPASPGLIRSTLAVRRCSRRPLDYVGERQRPYLVVPLVVSQTLGAIAFGIAWPATPPSNVHTTWSQAGCLCSWPLPS